jgi:hypothetical protein
MLKELWCSNAHIKSGPKIFHPTVSGYFAFPPSHLLFSSAAFFRFAPLHRFACICLHVPLSCPGRLASQRDHLAAPTRTVSLDGSPAQPRALRRAPRRGHRRRVRPGWIAAAARCSSPRCQCRYVVVQISLF